MFVRLQTVFQIIIKQVKAFKKVQQELVTTKKKRRNEVLDNLRIPSKLQEIFTTVACMCHHCIIATRDSQFCKMFLQLPVFCSEQVKALKDFSQELYTKDKQEKKKQRQEVTFGTTKKCLN